MEFKETEISGVWVIEPKVFNDARGYFFEAWKKAEFEAHVGQVAFLQDNESKSSYGVLRGLHYQKGEFSQAKLVRVIKGKVLDVAVDIRKSSPTFGKHVMVELSEDNKRQLFIPRGFAHGFLVLSDEAIFTYRSTMYMPRSTRRASGGMTRISISSGPSTPRTCRPARRTSRHARCTRQLSLTNVAYTIDAPMPHPKHCDCLYIYINRWQWG
jgi:dTDP-4-dehydrorhamnose 3,5-epimerase